MTLILRKQHAQDRIEGQEPPPDWSDDDYAVVDETLVGRIYRQPVQGGGIADTLEEARAALAARFEQFKREQ